MVGRLVPGESSLATSRFGPGLKEGHECFVPRVDYGSAPADMTINTQKHMQTPLLVSEWFAQRPIGCMGIFAEHKTVW